MPLVIDSETERLVRRLADATGTTRDAAAHDAVCARLSEVETTAVLLGRAGEDAVDTWRDLVAATDIEAAPY